MRRGLIRPFTVIGKSEPTLPFTVRMVMSAFSPSGTVTVMEPLVVEKSRLPAPTVPMRTSISPLTVLAFTGPPLDVASMPPLTVCASTSAVAPVISSPPLIELTSTFTPSGTRTVISRLTSSSLSRFQRSRLRRRLSWVRYPRSSHSSVASRQSAHTSTSPSPEPTRVTSTRTSSGLPRRQRFTAETSSRPPVARSTRTEPFRLRA